MVTLVNRAKMSTSTTGTGTITLGSAESGYQSFADAGVTNGDVVRYAIEDGDDWEIGSGTYTATGTTLSRTVDESSNSDAALNLTGSAVVFITAAAEDVFQGELIAENPSSPTAPSATGTNAVAIGSGAVSSGSGSVALGLSHASGLSSFAAANNYNNTSYGAIGAYSVALGNFAKASTTNSVAIGQGAQSTGNAAVTISAAPSGLNGASGNVATAIGGNSSGVGSNATGTAAMALGGSYASGTDSFAAAIANNTSSYGAAGANSVAIGYRAKASGSFSSIAFGLDAVSSGRASVAIGEGAVASADSAVSLGEDSTASGANSSVLGGLQNTASALRSVVLNGYQNTASGEYSVTSGVNAKADKHAKISHAGGQFSAQGDAQTGTMVLRSDTTDATPEALTANNSAAGTTNQVVLPNNSAYSFSGTIIARESAAAGSDYASWEIKGALLRDANAASTVLGNGIKNKLYASAGASAWDIALTADTTNGGLKIEVTGAAATNIRWVATVNTSEVTYA